MQQDTEELRRQIGHRLRLCRVDRSMLQKDLAEAIEVDQTQVSAWEGGRRMMRMEDAMRVAKVLKTSVGYLAGERAA